VSVPAGPWKGGRGNTAALRRRNLALVMSDVLEHQPTARFEIAERTGLARTSLTALVGDLVDARMLVERSSPADGRLGRPPAPLSIGGDHVGVVAVQVGVDDVVLDATDLGARPLHSARVGHRGHGVTPDEIAVIVGDLVRGADAIMSTTGTRIRRVMIVMDAPLIGRPPNVMTSLDLGWEDEVDLVTLVAAQMPEHAEALDLVNDANMAAVEEHRHVRAAGGEDIEDIIYLKADTGVGGAVIRSGVVETGAHGIGFEPGHLQVESHGEPCACGRRGCLVAVAGLDAIVERAGLGSVSDIGGVARAIVRLRDEAASGHPAVLASLHQAGMALSAAVVNLYVLFDPARIVLGGFWADVFEQLAVDDPPDSLTPPRLRADRIAEIPAAPKLVLAGRAGPAAARTGAIRHAIRALLDDPTALMAGAPKA
jgi:predicted NBD/HSP70 family sugar kinase